MIVSSHLPNREECARSKRRFVRTLGLIVREIGLLTR